METIGFSQTLDVLFYGPVILNFAYGSLHVCVLSCDLVSSNSNTSIRSSSSSRPLSALFREKKAQRRRRRRRWWWWWGWGWGWGWRWGWRLAVVGAAAAVTVAGGGGGGGGVGGSFFMATSTWVLKAGLKILSDHLLQCCLRPFLRSTS